MNEAQLARLFQPFAQVAELQRREGGAGLGLAISRQLVRLMGGEIRVDSREGHGSIFSFEIGAPTPPPAQALTAGGTPIGYEGERRRILVVDDAPQVRAMLRETVGRLGFEVAEARDGQEALFVAARLHPDLIVMNLMMPVMDGYEATRRLRLLPKGDAVPIIALSARVTTEVEALSRQAGVNTLIGKPVEPSSLLDAIAAMLGLTWVRKDAGSPAISVAVPHPTMPVQGDEILPHHRAVVRGARVLLVEDNVINRELALDLLRAAGIIVSVACDGREALDMLELQRFDAVLMDCLMPVMDGYAATRALRLRPDLQALPVIALTANAMVGDRDKALAAGMNDHIAKPIKFDELFTTLARWVRPAHHLG
jgi:CheY-like chemotaxis protein